MSITIRAQECNFARNYQSPFAAKNKNSQANKQGNSTVIDASNIKSKQDGFKEEKDKCIQSLYKQIENLKTFITKVKENTNWTKEQKEEKIQQIQDEIQELQKQVIEIQKEQKEKKEEEKVKKEEKESKTLAPEELKKRAEQAQQKMFTNLAFAYDKVGKVKENAAKVSNYITKGTRAMGPKYKGEQLSSAQINELFFKARHYAREISKDIRSIEENIYSIAKATNAYQKTKAQYDMKKQEDYKTSQAQQNPKTVEAKE